MGLDANERLSNRAEVEVLTEAVKTSYASATRTLGEDSVILYEGKKKKFVKTIKAIRKCALSEKVVNECEEYLLNNWDSAVRRMQDKSVYGCSAEGHVSHMYSDCMSSRPMGWSEAGTDAMCQSRRYVKDY